jgi:predicted N-acyltransferase
MTNEKQRSAIKALLEAVEKEALARKLSIVFHRVMDIEKELINILINKKYYQTIGAPLNYMDINWVSFDKYLQQIKSMSKKRFKNIRYEINKSKREGVVIRKLSDIRGHEERIYQLLKGNHEKHNNSNFPFNKDFLLHIKENFRDDAVFYIASKNKQIVGANLLLKRKTTGFCSFVGVDHEMAGNDFTYFNLTYYQRVSYAIRNNIRKLYYGNALYEMKRKRGCKISRTQIFYKPLDIFGSVKTKVLFYFHSKWMKHKLPEFDNQP